MIAVVDSPDQPLEFTVGSRMSLHAFGITVQSEWIEFVKRTATRAELAELLDVIYATGYSDHFGANYFIGRNEAGIETFYFVDTGLDSFSRRPPKLLAGEIVAPEDKEWFESESARLAVGCSYDLPSISIADEIFSIVRSEHGFFGRHSDDRRRYGITLDTL